LSEIEKQPKITVKGLGEITEKDYRGLIAIIFSVGTIIIASISVAQSRLDIFTSVMAVLGPILTLIIKDYFQSQSKE
jgi:hypothetical protein